MTYKNFFQVITEDVDFLDEAALNYNRYHARRFYKTYVECAKYLAKGDKLLSIGAGIAPIEKVLAKEIGVEITVVDFPDLIENFASYYTYLGFKMHCADLTKEDLSFPDSFFDMVLSSEVVEHVPKPIYKQFLPFDKSIRKRGKIVITTPNLSSIVHILKLIFMRPIMPPADKVFSEVSFENQAYHRREYMPVEIVDELEKLNYNHIATEFFFYTYPSKMATKLLYAVAGAIPRFRSGMLIVGEKR